MSSLVAKLQSIEESLPIGNSIYVAPSTEADEFRHLDQDVRNSDAQDLNDFINMNAEFVHDNMSSVSDASLSDMQDSSMHSGQYEIHAPLTRRQEVALQREARLKAELENLRFHPQLITKKSSTSYSDSVESILGTSRFEILYNEARERQRVGKNAAAVDRSSFTPKITKRAKSRERSESPTERANRLHNGIGAGRPNPDLEKHFSDPHLFRPKITKRAKSLERNDAVPLIERLHNRAQAIQEKHSQLKVSLEKKLEDECTFAPRINSRKSPLRQHEYRTPMEISDRMQKYIQERERRLAEAQRAKEEQEYLHSPFKPQLVAKKQISSRADVDLVDVFTRLSVEKDFSRSSVSSDQSFSFQPTIHTRRRSSNGSTGQDDGTSPGSPGTVFERLFEKGEQRRRELEIERQLKLEEDMKDLTFTPSLPQRDRASISTGINMNGSGSSIRSPDSSSVSVSSTGERSGSQVVDRLTNGKSAHYVQDILMRLKTDLEMRECTFKPEINHVSIKKSEDRSATPVHERLAAYAEKLRLINKQREEEYRQKELEECTFTPVIPRTTVSMVKNSRSDVFERLIRDEKAKEVASKVREKEHEKIELEGCTFQPKLMSNNASTQINRKSDVFERLAPKSPTHSSGSSSITSTGVPVVNNGLVMNGSSAVTNSTPFSSQRRRSSGKPVPMDLEKKKASVSSAVTSKSGASAGNDLSSEKADSVSGSTSVASTSSSRPSSSTGHGQRRSLASPIIVPRSGGTSSRSSTPKKNDVTAAGFSKSTSSSRSSSRATTPLPVNNNPVTAVKSNTITGGPSNTKRPRSSSTSRGSSSLQARSNTMQSLRTPVKSYQQSLAVDNDSEKGQRDEAVSGELVDELTVLDLTKTVPSTPAGSLLDMLHSAEVGVTSDALDDEYGEYESEPAPMSAISSIVRPKSSSKGGANALFTAEVGAPEDPVIAEAALTLASIEMKTSAEALGNDVLMADYDPYPVSPDDSITMITNEYFGRKGNIDVNPENDLDQISSYNDLVDFTQM